ncbi:IS6 family transposase, partial [Paraburkholderia aspalathi]|nr:IS6 family transposase [Paraburkholderia aspalathi]
MDHGPCHVAEHTSRLGIFVFDGQTLVDDLGNATVVRAFSAHSLCRINAGKVKIQDGRKRSGHTMKKTTTPRTTPAPDIAKVAKRLHYPLEVILQCVKWRGAYSPSVRKLEEMSVERDIRVDHSTGHRLI